VKGRTHLGTITLTDTTEELVEGLVENIFKEIKTSGNIFYKPIVICPNGNIRNYLVLSIANNKKYNIASGIEFTTIESYLKKSLLGGQKLVDETLFGLFVLGVLKENRNQFPTLEKIIQNKESELSQNKLIDMSIAMGNLLVRYQKELGNGWLEIVNNKHEYYSEENKLYDIVFEKIETILVERKDYRKFILYGELPKLVSDNYKLFNQPVHIVGASNLIFLHLESLKELKNEIVFYQLYPYISSKNNWSSPIIKNLEERVGYITKHLNLKTIQNKTNTLKKEKRTNLSIFQDLLIGHDVTQESKEDLSVQVLISPTLTREVEAVHAHILSQLESDPTLSPNDFLVLLPSLNLYANTVISVFSKKNRITFENGRYMDTNLPFILTDESAGKESSYYHAIRDFFELGMSESLSRRNCISLLRHTCVQNAYDLANDEIKIIYKWFDAYKFYRELSPEEKSLDTKPNEIKRELFSLDTMLKRIRLGLFLEPNSEEIFSTKEGIDYIPFSNLNREHLLILEKLHRIRNKWKNWQTWLQSDTIDPNQLFILVQENLKTNPLLYSERKFESKLRNFLDELSTHFSNSLSGVEINRMILDLLSDDKETKSSILENGVTISGIQPVRPIPFKIVYILGLNQGNFGVNPEKSPFDLFDDAEKKNDFKILQSDEAAKVMLLESILSAREKLTLSFVVQESTEDLKILLNSSNNSKYISMFNLSDYSSIEEDLIKKSINSLFSKTGNILGSLINSCKIAQLKIPLNPIPLSRYSKFYFYKNSNFTGDFIRSIDKKKAITMLYEKGTNSGVTEKDYLRIFHLRSKVKNIELREIEYEVPKRLDISNLVTFLFNPLDDFLMRLDGFYNEIQIDPNMDTDPYELSEKSLVKKMIPFLNKSHTNLSEELYGKIPIWKAKGELPLGNWELLEKDFRLKIDEILKNVLDSNEEDPIQYEIKNGNFYKEKKDYPTKPFLNNFKEICHTWYLRNNNFINFYAYGKSTSESIARKDHLAGAIAQFLLEENARHSYSLGYLDKGNLKIGKIPNSGDLIIDANSIQRFQSLFSKLVEEYLLSPFPYDLGNLEIKKYNGSLDTIDDIFKKDDYVYGEKSYESLQRNSKNLILGDRVPNSKTREDDLLRVQRIIELQRDFLSLTGLLNFEETEPKMKKKGKKK
jgi:exonuclease V gamma subunit